jgi:hypothetical protein
MALADARAPATTARAGSPTSVSFHLGESARSPVSSTLPESSDRFTLTDAIAGFMAAGSLALSFIAAGFGLVIGLEARPGRLAPVAAVLALVAARMSTRFQRLAYTAVIAAMIGWTLGMTLAVITDNPIF